MQTSNDRFTHRKGTKAVKITGGAGGNRPVTVKQVRHSFLFGCSEFSTLPYVNKEMKPAAAADAEKRFGYMTDLFNSVTLPFYWGRYEPEQGKPDQTRTENAARWLKERGMVLKGHPLCWHTVCAPWLLSMSNDEIFETQLARIRRDITAFKGLIDMWDVINEAVIMPVFNKYDNGITRICQARGRIKLIRDLFAEARSTSSTATLLINDFDTSVAYDILIEGLLEAGVPIDVIGIQSHMHQGYWGVERTQEILGRFSRFGLPLHFTEVSLVSGDIMPPEIEDLNDFQVKSWPSCTQGETRQAEETAMFYESLFAHPLVQSVTWWSFMDGLWLGAPSGLLDKNSEPKPAYRALHERIKGDWWSGEQQLTTDGAGEITVSGFKGDYIAVCESQETKFTI